MIVCPLCEHSQPAADACEVCGRPLAVPAGALASIPPLDGLEPTGLAAAGEVDVPPLDGLEPTVREPGGPASAGPAPPEPFPGLEPTGAARVEVEVTPVPDIEPTASGIPGDGPTPLPAVAICRYCRTPAAPGERRCGRCGMRLPAAARGEGDVAGAPEEVRICSCGARVTGAVCPACGARIPGSLEG